MRELMRQLEESKGVLPTMQQILRDRDAMRRVATFLAAGKGDGAFLFLKKYNRLSSDMNSAMLNIDDLGFRAAESDYEFTAGDAAALEDFDEALQGMEWAIGGLRAQMRQAAKRT